VSSGHGGQQSAECMGAPGEMVELARAPPRALFGAVAPVACGGPSRARRAWQEAPQRATRPAPGAAGAPAPSGPAGRGRARAGGRRARAARRAAPQTRPAIPAPPCRGHPASARPPARAARG
jgi:hypothetical protein